MTLAKLLALGWHFSSSDQVKLFSINKVKAASLRFKLLCLLP